MPQSKNVADQEVEMDRRRKDRRNEESNSLDSTSAPITGTPEAEQKTPRRKKQRRRQIDPTTCERDYNDEELNFMRALDEYKRSSGRMFPTCSEILEVIRDLGYIKLSEEEEQLLASINEVEEELAEAVETDEFSLCEEDEDSLV